MTQSIRTFLIINLLLSVTLILSLAIIGNLFLEHRNMQKRLDTQLAYTALHIESFISASTSTNDVKRIQGLIDSIPQRSHAALPFSPDDEVVKRIVYPKFQIWRGKDLLLKSGHLPQNDIGGKNTGFTSHMLKGNKWRIFTTVIPHRNIKVVVAENYDLHEHLEGRITQSSVLMILVSYPILALLIWIIVGRGLDSIRHVTREIKHRAPHFLNPVKLQMVPVEVQPFVDELNTLLGELDCTLQREKRFASDAAHELRTPLAALKAQTQLALRAKTSKDKDQALKQVMQSINRSTHVIEQLLTLCRMAPEASLEGKTDLNLVKTASDVIAELYPTAIKKDSELELITDHKRVTMIAHPTGIAMLLRNLIDNAIKYTPEKSLIKIYIERDAQQIILRVADNGKGIPDEMRDRVFERFFRGLGETSPGCGLGLGIVKQVIDSHNAQISLHTPEWGHGLEVKVMFAR